MFVKSLLEYSTTLILVRSQFVNVKHYFSIRSKTRLFPRNVVPRLTLYVCAEGESLYSALYLERATYKELVRKLSSLFSLSPNAIQDVYWQGPSGIHVKLNDEVM